MRRQTIFTFRVSREERLLISRLAEFLQRSQSDAVRFVVLDACSSLDDTVMSGRYQLSSPCTSSPIRNPEFQTKKVEFNNPG
jgi:hypothetical protein